MLSKPYIENYKINLSLAYPIMLGQVGHILTGIADSIMVGNISAEHLAAGALGHSIYIVFFILGLGIATGITPLVGIAYGEKNYRECGVYFKNGLLSVMVIGLIMMLLMIASVPLLDYIGQAPEVIKLAKSYYVISSLSLIPSMLFVSFKQFTEGITLTKPAMYASIVFNLVNVFLNYIFIYGNFGFPRMELDGAGWASLIARTGMGLSLVFYVFFNPDFKIYTDKLDWKKYSINHIKRILKLGLPISLQFLLEVGSFTFGALMMGWLGSNELAAHQIAISIAGFTYLAASGIGSAATIRLSNLLGERKIGELKVSGNASLVLVLIWMSIAAVLMILLRYHLPSLYVSELPVIELTASLFIVAAFFQIFDGVQVTALGALRGIKDVRVPTFISLLSYWIIALPVGYILAFTFELGAVGIWLGYLSGLFIAAILLFFRFRKLIKSLSNT
ncbi:MAG: MATE family efflux transporter [Candidatus Kapabacteria bacterium]|nr:MATE family efflux transporter [Ignavibacteriota bacterium]MCW5884250.1 MATE family efflux transporter [Candidatus Kapabacteria bacterium]